MEVYINHNGGLHKLKYETEFPKDRIKKNEGVAKIYFDKPSFFWVAHRERVSLLMYEQDTKTGYQGTTTRGL